MSVAFRCMSKGFKPDSIDEAIEEYEELNVFSVNQAKTKITFVDVNWSIPKLLILSVLLNSSFLKITTFQDTKRAFLNKQSKFSSCLITSIIVLVF